MAEASHAELAGRVEEGVHRLAIRVYYEDTDFSGAVYHANYLKFCERGRSDFLRLRGIHHHELDARDRGGFVVRRMLCDFLKPAGIDDVLSVETWVTGVSGARLELGQRIWREEELLFAAEVTAALATNGRPRRLPKEMAATLSRLVRQSPTS